MVCLVVATHGHLAEDLVAFSSMVVGPSDNVVAVTFDPSEGPDDLLAKYTAAVEASSSQEYLILVDLFGGSPYNAAAWFTAGRDDADVVTSVSLPMVIGVLSRRLTGAGLAKLVEAVRTSVVDGVKVPFEVFTPAPTTTSDDEGNGL